MNLRDIARLSGVSRSTVSRVINDDPRVSDAVRARVKEIIEREGYQPHAAARALATRRSGMFGLVIPQLLSTLFGDPWYPLFTQGCLDAARENGVGLMLLMEPVNDPLAVEHLIDRFVMAKRVDGLVIAASLVDDVLIAKLENINFPYMLVGRSRDEDRSFVDIRNREASAEATRHLLSHGRCRPAMIAGPDDMLAAHDRRLGFQDAVCAAGFDPAQVPILEVSFSQSGAYNTALELLASDDRPDAIFAASDSMAYGVMRAASELGISVPDDLGIFGFDGIEPDRLFAGELSTVRQPVNQLGSVAISRLNDFVHHRRTGPEQVWLETELVLRHSCGCRSPVDTHAAMASGKEGRITPV